MNAFEPPYCERKLATVLGARQGVENIGSAIVEDLESFDWTVTGDDCYREQLRTYIIPEISPYSDALIICLGMTNGDPLHEQAEPLLEAIIRANLTLPLRAAARYISARMEKGKGGRIVLLGSYAHRHPLSNSIPYCAAKAGINMAAQCLGWDYTKHGFYTVAVHPYHVTDSEHMWEEVQKNVMKAKWMTREQADEYANRDLQMPKPLSRWDIARTVSRWLESDAAAWQSGSSIELFGGSR